MENTASARKRLFETVFTGASIKPGTRNIPEHAGTIKIIFMKIKNNNNNNNKIIFIKINTNVK